MLGGGGHGRVVFDLVNELNQGWQTFFFDDRWNVSRGLGGMKFLGSVDYFFDHYRELKLDQVVIAIGDNQTRKRLWQRVEANGLLSPILVHPSTVVSRYARIEPGTVLCGRAFIGPGSRIGKNCIINTAASIDHDCQIEDHVHIGPGVNLAGSVSVGEGVLIGTGANVIPGICIGHYSIVGAGAAVIRDLPSYGIAVGVPARLIKSRKG